MTLSADEFIRRFLLHLLPTGFHRIRHYGLLAGGTRKDSLALARKLLAVAPPHKDNSPEEPTDTRPPCPYCGGQMAVIKALHAGSSPALRRPHHRPGRSRHDPAWLASNTPRSHCAPGDVTACTITASSRPDDHIRQRSQPEFTSPGSHDPVSHDPSRCLGYSPPAQPKRENPIAHRVPPAVRASGTSVRLQRPEPFT